MSAWPANANKLHQRSHCVGRCHWHPRWRTIGTEGFSAPQPRDPGRTRAPGKLWIQRGPPGPLCWPAPARNTAAIPGQGVVDPTRPAAGGAAPATGLAAVAAPAGRRWPPVRTGLALWAPRPGTLHPNADRPVACPVGCHLAAVASRALRTLRVPSGWPTATLDPAVVHEARRDPVARGGRGPEPTRQAAQEAEQPRAGQQFPVPQAQRGPKCGDLTSRELWATSTFSAFSTARQGVSVPVRGQGLMSLGVRAHMSVAGQARVTPGHHLHPGA
jgi:hypothetical protein